MDPNKLLKDELIYELRVRGFTDLQGETSKSMRRKLQDILRVDAFGELPAIVGEFAPVVVDEIEGCVRKVEQLENYLLNYKGLGGPAAVHIETKLKHLYARLGRLQVADEEANQPIRHSISNLVDRLGKIEAQVDELDEAACLAQVGSTGEYQATEEAVRITPTSTVVNIHKHQLHPRKWNLFFSGQGGGLSVAAFLEQLEEKRIASNLSQAELMSSIGDLLQGDAKVCYSAKKDRIASWAEFVTWLREEYQGIFFQQDLLREIRQRSQGESERVGHYFACMINYFRRLPKPLSEEEKLEILRGNIHPYYIHNLGLATYETVDQLCSLCRRLEINKTIAERCEPPPASTSGLREPDLACPGDSKSASVKSSRVETIEVSGQCWNCRERGHRFSKCLKERRRSFCYGCGQEGVFRRNCPKCSGNAAADVEATERRPAPDQRR